MRLFIYIILFVIWTKAKDVWRPFSPVEIGSQPALLAARAHGNFPIGRKTSFVATPILFLKVASLRLSFIKRLSFI